MSDRVDGRGGRGRAGSRGGRRDPSAAAPVWIGTSWKMNKTLAEADAFVDGLLASEPSPRVARFVIPPYTVLREVARRLADTDVRVGAQNLHWRDAGPWTGEISAPMLVDCGASMVEIGHSERRAHFGETDATVGLKVSAALRHGLLPLVCVGETLEERDANRADEVLEAQVRGALAQAGADASVSFAYEPVWAIGDAGTPASSDYADARQAHVKAVAGSLLDDVPPCLYGGSVNADNCAGLVACRHVDGLFIGRSAWRVDGYLDIVARCAAALHSSPSP